MAYEKSDPECKEYKFRDLTQLQKLTKESEAIYDKASKNFKHPFVFVTTDRTYEVVASSEEERNMWMAGIKYVLISATEVQLIMQEEAKQKDKLPPYQKPRLNSTTASDFKSFSKGFKNENPSARLPPRHEENGDRSLLPGNND